MAAADNPKKRFIKPCFIHLRRLQKPFPFIQCQDKLTLDMGLKVRDSLLKNVKQLSALVPLSLEENSPLLSPMTLHFHKYQGAGNDFILIDDRDGLFPADHQDMIQRITNRKYGIGSDGVLLIQNSERADLYFDFINPDGSRSFCGNGSRCGVRFAQDLGLISESCTFDAIDGLHKAFMREDLVQISMRDVNECRTELGGTFMDTGSPHLVIQRDRLSEIDVEAEGRAIRNHEIYSPSGVNVNFIETVSEGEIGIRTYERGVEGETLACGTGVTAAALSHAQNMNADSGRIKVQSRGGLLEVGFQKSENGFTEVWLRGPAEFVFKGSIEI